MPSLLTRIERYHLQVSALLFLTLFAPAAVAQAPRYPTEWPAAGRDAQPWTRWWWMGSAVTREHITSELQQMARAGFGGVEVTAIYGVRGADSASVPYLSPQWVKLLAHTAATAHRLGMGVDLPQGSGWRMGGPFVPAADVNASLRVTRDSARGGAYVAAIRPSGDRVKRPAPGGEGPAIDVFSRAATDRYLTTVADRLAPLPRGAIRSFFHDSFEYTGDGSSELFAAFTRRRGYDLTTELPALAGEGDRDRVARVKSDYRQTLDEMLLENFVQRLTVWSHERGSMMREQAHGSPGNLLDLYAAADIPETESFGPLGGPDANPLIFRFASSAAHVAGRRLASAEAFTWLGEHFSTSLDEIKRAADQLFLAGINHLVYHGTAYSPTDASWPGWEFYASSEFNPRNAWWRDLPAFNAYVTRVQSVLQEG
ncbi:MAG: glycosyl hydrolase, partial [Gemmatimonadaceae bacterium]